MFDVSIESVVSSESAPMSERRPITPPAAGYPLELELLESALRAGRLSLRSALFDAYRARPSAVCTQP